MVPDTATPYADPDCRSPEHDHDQQRAGHQQPVGGRARRSGRPRRTRSARCRTRGQNPICTAWRVSENTPEISAWEAITVAAAASTISGTSAQCGHQLVERAVGRMRDRQHQRALAEIVQHQRRQHQRRTRRAGSPARRHGPYRRKAPRPRSAQGRWRRTPPRRSPGFPVRMGTRPRGLSAVTIAGAAVMLTAPSSPMTRNQATITGPNSRPIRWVPWRWMANSATRIASVTGRMKGGSRVRQASVPPSPTAPRSQA